MALNPSIFGNMLNAPKSPEEYTAEREQLQSARMTNMLNRQKMDEYQAGVKRQGELRNLLMGSANADALRRGGFLSEAADMEKNAAEVGFKKAQTLSSEAQARKADTEANMKVWESYRDQASMIRTPQEAAAYLSRGYNDPVIGPYLQRVGSLEEGIARIPQDPAGFEQWRMGVGMNVEKLAKHALEQQQFGETVRDNKARVAATIRGQDVAASTARRGQDISAASAKEAREQNDRHFKATQAAGGKSGAATEDERKAAGWFAQADNAWKNMQAAMGGVDPQTGAFKNEGVARPGIPDAIAAIPSFGIGEVVGNSMRSADRQKFMQASSSLSEAILRAATGAGVNKDEAAQKVRELTPVFGEDPATTKQKMDSIPMYLNSLKQRAGRAMPQSGGATGSWGDGWTIQEVK